VTFVSDHAELCQNPSGPVQSVLRALVGMVDEPHEVRVTSWSSRGGRSCPCTHAAVLQGCGAGLDELNEFAEVVANGVADGRPGHLFGLLREIRTRIRFHS
jgi:hypothetical protein